MRLIPIAAYKLVKLLEKAGFRHFNLVGNYYKKGRNEC